MSDRLKHNEAYYNFFFKENHIFGFSFRSTHKDHSIHACISNYYKTDIDES